MVKHCVLWIPTVTRGKKALVKNQVEDVPLSDIGTDIKCDFTFLRRNEKNLQDAIIITSKEGKKLFQFTELADNKHGFVLYKYEIFEETVKAEIKESESGEEDSFARGVISKLEVVPHAIYHAIKDFYHEHVYLYQDIDASLSVYLIDEVFETTNKEKYFRDALVHYIEEFDDIFGVYRKDIKKRYIVIDSIMNKEKQDTRWAKIKNFCDRFIHILSRQEKCRDIIAFCNVSLGQELYYNVLLNLCDQSMRKQIETAQGEIISINDTIFNIENALKSIKDFESKTNYKLSLLFNLSRARFAVLLIPVSAIVSLIISYLYHKYC